MDLELYIDPNYEFKNSSAIKYYYLNLNAEAVQSAFNRNFKNANYVLEESGAVIPGVVENLLDDDYENNRGLVYKVE